MSLQYILAVLIIIVNFIFQSTLLQYFDIGGVVPNTTLIMVVIVSLLRGKYQGAAVGLVAGLMQDIFFSTTIGINALIYLLIGYVVGLLDDKVFKESSFLPLVTIILSTITYNAMYYLFMMFSSVDVSVTSVIRNLIVKETIYNSIVCILVYLLILRFFNRPRKSYTVKF